MCYIRPAFAVILGGGSEEQRDRFFRPTSDAALSDKTMTLTLTITEIDKDTLQVRVGERETTVSKRQWMGSFYKKLRAMMMASEVRPGVFNPTVRSAGSQDEEEEGEEHVRKNATEDGARRAERITSLLVPAIQAGRDQSSGGGQDGKDDEEAKEGDDDDDGNDEGDEGEEEDVQEEDVELAAVEVVREDIVVLPASATMMRVIREVERTWGVKEVRLCRTPLWNRLREVSALESVVDFVDRKVYLHWEAVEGEAETVNWTDEEEEAAMNDDVPWLLVKMITDAEDAGQKSLQLQTGDDEGFAMVQDEANSRGFMVKEWCREEVKVHPRDVLLEWKRTDGEMFVRVISAYADFIHGQRVFKKWSQVMAWRQGLMLMKTKDEGMKVPEMTLNVKRVGQDDLTLSAPETWTVQDLHHKICFETKMMPEDFWLEHGGISLTFTEEQKTVVEAGLQDGAAVLMHIRGKGGASVKKTGTKKKAGGGKKNAKKASDSDDSEEIEGGAGEEENGGLATLDARIFKALHVTVGDELKPLQSFLEGLKRDFETPEGLTTYLRTVDKADIADAIASASEKVNRLRLRKTAAHLFSPAMTTFKKESMMLQQTMLDIVMCAPFAPLCFAARAWCIFVQPWCTGMVHFCAMVVHGGGAF
jgi:hypothetical protein